MSLVTYMPPQQGRGVAPLDRFRFQVLIYGFACTGRDTPDVAIAEDRDEPEVLWRSGGSWRSIPMWDLDASEQQRTVRVNGGPPPLWHSLPWVGEHTRRRGNEETR